MATKTAELEARLELLETALFGEEEQEEEAYCEICGTFGCCDEGNGSDGFTGSGFAFPEGTGPEFTHVVLHGAEQAINRLTEITESEDDADALKASSLLLQYGLALIDRGRA